MVSFQLFLYFTGCQTSRNNLKVHNSLQTMKLYFLLLIVAIVASPAADKIVGGFTQRKDSQSQNYKDVVSFIKGRLPELAEWNVDSLKSQVVNGFNYKVSLSLAEDKADVIVYSTFSGLMTLRAYTLNSVPQTIPQTQETHNLIVIERKQGVKQSVTPSLSNNPDGPSSSNINAIQKQVSTVNDVFSVSNPMILDNFFVGGYRPVPVSEKSSYQDAWNSIVSKYSYLQNYQILQVRRQLVAGLNYIFIVESQAKNRIMVIKVYQSLSNQFSISILQTNTAVGFSSEDILAFQKKCVELKPELSQYQLAYIANSQFSNGVTFTFLLDSSYIIADCRFEEGKVVVTFQ